MWSTHQQWEQFCSQTASFPWKNTFQWFKVWRKISMRQYECNIIQQVWILKGYTDHTRYTEGALGEEWSLIDANKQRKNSLLFGKIQHISVWSGLVASLQLHHSLSLTVLQGLFSFKRDRISPSGTKTISLWGLCVGTPNVCTVTQNWVQGQHVTLHLKVIESEAH